MLTLDLMKDLQLGPIPYGQILVAATLITPDYNKPFAPTKVVIEGMEHIPKHGRVILALNHTDRYNYFPLQYTFWRRKTGIYTATWVKGKYFNSAAIAKFMVKTNNIPTPSKGYILTSDAVALLGKPPEDDLYRLIRDTFNAPAHERDLDAVREKAHTQGHGPELERLLKTPRRILGFDFNPKQLDYFAALDELFAALMHHFIRLNAQAFDHGHKVIVFPEGTRSLRLTTGRPGLAQMALRMKATVVPIGCNGSDKLFPGSNPFSKGGTVTYRIGAPLRPDHELKDLQIQDDFTPFTKEAEQAYGDTFQEATSLIMSRIAALLDPEYLPEAGESTEVRGANRFL